MAQSLWFFGSRLNIVADHTTTRGQYDLIEGYFPPGTQTPPIATRAISNNSMCCPGSSRSRQVQGSAECWRQLPDSYWQTPRGRCAQ